MSEEVVPEDNIQLDLTQVLAAIIKNMGVVALPIASVFADYTKYKMALSIDEETNMMILELVEENQIES
jgi:hypothetical protein